MGGLTTWEWILISPMAIGTIGATICLIVNTIHYHRYLWKKKKEEETK